MLFLNLLPRKFERDFQIKGWLVVSLWFLLAIFIGLGVSFAIFYAGNAKVCEFRDNLLGYSENEKRVKIDDIEKFKKIDKKVAGIHSIQKEMIAWPDLWHDLGKIINQENVRLNYIKIDKVEKEIVFDGMAESRDRFLEMRDLLESSKKFYDIRFSQDILLQKSNIEFSLSLRFKS